MGKMRDILEGATTDIQYKGWTIKPYEGTQIGYRNAPSRKIKVQTFNGKDGAYSGDKEHLILNPAHRQIKGYTIEHPEEGAMNKVFDNLQQAKRYIDNY